MSTIAVLVTPTKRKKRPSLFPKQAEKRSRKSDPYPQTSRSNEVDDVYDVEKANPAEFITALDYYDKETRSFKSSTAAERRQLLSELRKWHAGIEALMITPPFIFSECSPLPEMSTAPFLIAGLVAQYLDEDDGYPIDSAFMGEQGAVELDDVPPSVIDDMKHFTIPTKASFAYLFHIIPQATHITSYPTQLLIELRRRDDDEFAKLLQTLPAYVGDFDIGYLNGVS